MGHLEAHCSHVCLSHITERPDGRYDSEPMEPDSLPEDNGRNRVRHLAGGRCDIKCETKENNR